MLPCYRDPSASALGYVYVAPPGLIWQDTRPGISFLLLGGHQIGKDEAVAFDDFAGRYLQRRGKHGAGNGENGGLKAAAAQTTQAEGSLVPQDRPGRRRRAPLGMTAVSCVGCDENRQEPHA